MLREIDGKRIDLYQLGVWLSSRKACTGEIVRPSQVTPELAREALADNYDFTGLYAKRPAGLRFPDNPEHAEAYRRNQQHRVSR